MTPDLNNKFARLIWKDRLWSLDLTLKTTEGASVTVINYGEPDELTNNFINAKVNIGGLVQTGTITFQDHDVLCGNDVVLQALVSRGERLCNERGELMPQLMLPVERNLIDSYKNLLAYSTSYSCADYIASLESCQRVASITRLLVDRLERKRTDLMRIHAAGDNNWNNTLYVALFKAVGVPLNQEPFTRLAYTVPYDVVSKESGNPEMVEALLFGASGLLQIREERKPYITKMKDDFEYLQSKYGIKQLSASVWSLRGSNPNGRVELKISQLAAFLSTAEFIFNNLIACRTTKDVHRLFAANASQYWSDVVTQNSTDTALKRIGDERKSVLGINLVVPIMFAYSKAMGIEALTENAIELLEDIPAENNAIVKGWHKGGVKCSSGFDSQAMIQLYKEFCVLKRCSECPFGRAQINKMYTKITK